MIKLKVLTSAIIIGTSIYLHPCLSSDLVEESDVLNHSGEILENLSSGLT